MVLVQNINNHLSLLYSHKHALVNYYNILLHWLRLTILNVVEREAIVQYAVLNQIAEKEFSTVTATAMCVVVIEI